MKRFVLVLLILVSSSPAFSQKLYFIYLQSENDQPFFLKVNDKVHSSSASGYLVLSKLRDSSYALSVGFPQNKFPEQNFNVDIKGKDRGYILKNFGEKGWGLFDLQTLNIQMALPEKGKTGIKTEPRDDISPFTEILAKAANDPSLKERPVAVKMEEKPVAIQSAVLKEEVKQITGKPEEKQTQVPVVSKEDPPVTKTEQPVINEDQVAVKPTQQLIIEIIEPAIIRKEEPVKPEEVKIIPAIEYKRSVVTKKSESSTSEGFGLTYIDEYAEGYRDTIRIIIPNPRISPAEVKEKPKEEKKFLDISPTDTVTRSETAAKEIKKENPVQKQFTNSNCKDIASESDFSKLQKKMIGEKNDDDMVNEARKVFKSRCFATEQLKGLSALFLNDAGKYKLFDAAYAYVSDTENFPSLSAELKDEYYVNRFKAMLR